MRYLHTRYANVLELLLSLTGNALVHDRFHDVKLGSCFRDLVDAHNASSDEKYKLGRECVIRHMMACTVFINDAVSSSAVPGVVFVHRSKAFARWGKLL